MPGPEATLTLPSPALPVPDISLTSGLIRCSECSRLGWQGLLGPLCPLRATAPKIGQQRNLVLQVGAHPLNPQRHQVWSGPQDPLRCLEQRTGSAEPG